MNYCFRELEKVKVDTHSPLKCLLKCRAQATGEVSGLVPSGQGAPPRGHHGSLHEKGPAAMSGEEEQSLVLDIGRWPRGEPRPKNLCWERECQPRCVLLQ